MKEEQFKELEKKYNELQEQLNFEMSSVTIDNISEKVTEITYIQGMIQMLDDTVFFLRQGVWEYDLPITITKEGE